MPSKLKTLLIAVVLVGIGFCAALFLPKGDHAAHGDATSNAPVEWTCSMHPQIRLPEFGKCPICFMDLIPAEDGEAVGPRQLSLSEEAIALADIRTAAADTRPVEHELRLVGRVVVDETHVEYISAWVPGRLEQLHVDYTGVAVREGQPLVELYSPELFAAQQELLQAADAAATRGGSAKARLASSRQRMRLWGVADDQIDAVLMRGSAEDTITLRSPSSGVVITKSASEGMYVKTGTHIYTVADLAYLWAELEAYESDLPWLKVGQAVTFRTDAVPGEEFDGTISFIDSVLDPQTRTVAVRVDVPNPTGILKPDLFVSATVLASIPGDPVSIPATAPLITGRRAIVYVRVPDTDSPVFEGREVVLGPRAGDRYVVRNGLAAGEQVVVSGGFKLDSALQLQAKPSMMSIASEPKREHLSKAAQAAMAAGVAAYLPWQVALRSDHADEASEAARALASALAVDGRLKPLAVVRSAAAAAADATDIEEQRVHFKTASDVLIALIKEQGNFAEPLGLYYCPMAFDDTGAYWLQSMGSKLLNPYFGSSMLRCGNIVRELPLER